MNKCIIGIASAVMFSLASIGAKAALINGDIAFGTAVGASWTPADSSLVTGVATTADADGIVFNEGINTQLIDDGVVTSAFGDYTSTLGAFVDFNNFVFNPFTPSPTLWTFMSGGNTYSFKMFTLAVDLQDSNSIVLSGVGVASISGFTDTSGDYTLTVNQNERAFSFSSSASVVPVPAAVWLFGSGLIGLVGIARRKKPA